MARSKVCEHERFCYNLGKRRYGRALEWLQRGLSRARGEMLFYTHQISILHTIRGDYDSARKVLTDCIESGLADASLRVSYGRLLLDFIEDAAQAQKELEIAVADPTLENYKKNEAYNLLGRAYLRLGNVTEALRCYEQTLGLPLAPDFSLEKQLMDEGILPAR